MSLFGVKIGNPSGSTGGGALTLATVTVDATVGTKQDLLPAVGAGVQRIVSDVIVRNASQSLAAINLGNGFSVGYDAGATDVVGVTSTSLNLITDSVKSVKCSIIEPAAVGVEGDVLGCKVDPVLYPPMVVAGAGTAAANGSYSHQGITQSRPQWVTISDDSIFWDGIDRWKIVGDGPSYYYSLDDVATPDLCTTWVADVDGSNPVPTVTAGANPTFDVDVFYYDVAI